MALLWVSWVQWKTRIYMHNQVHQHFQRGISKSVTVSHPDSGPRVDDASRLTSSGGPYLLQEPKQMSILVPPLTSQTNFLPGLITCGRRIFLLFKIFFKSSLYGPLGCGSANTEVYFTYYTLQECFYTLVQKLPWQDPSRHGRKSTWEIIKVHSVTSQTRKLSPEKEKLAQEPWELSCYTFAVSTGVRLVLENLVLLKVKRKKKYLKCRHICFGKGQPRVHKVTKNTSDTTTNICFWNNREGCLLFERILFAIM